MLYHAQDTGLIIQNSFSVMAAEDMPEIGKEDPDVARERKRVKTGGASESVVKLENLTKFYKTVKLGKMLAVQRLSLGIPRGEVR